VVLHVLYLVFNEGHTTSSGPGLHRADLTAEAIRLTRLLDRLLPGDGGVAGLHDEAVTAEETDWPQILALYDVLATMAPGPVVTLKPAAALAMVHGPKAGLALLGTLDTDDRMAHPPPRSSTGTPARTRRRHRRCPRPLPPGGQNDREAARTALPRTARSPTAPHRTARRPGRLTSVHRRHAGSLRRDRLTERLAAQPGVAGAVCVGRGCRSRHSGVDRRRGTGWCARPGRGSPAGRGDQAGRE
jgi:hypothetical protein